MQIAQASDVGFLALHAKQTQHQRQKKEIHLAVHSYRN